MRASSSSAAQVLLEGPVLSHGLWVEEQVAKKTENTNTWTDETRQTVKLARTEPSDIKP